MDRGRTPPSEGVGHQSPSTQNRREQQARAHLDFSDSSSGTSPAQSSDLSLHGKGSQLREDREATHREDERADELEQKQGKALPQKKLNPLGQRHEIAKNAQLILRKLQDSTHPTASNLSHEKLQEIAFLINLVANDTSGKGYKKPNDVNNDEKLDKISKKEINRILRIKIGNDLKKWKDFLEANGEGEQPSIERTLALWHRHVKAQVKTIDNRLKRALFYKVPKLQQSSEEHEVPDLQQSSEENAIQTTWERLKELKPDLTEAQGAAEKYLKELKPDLTGAQRAVGSRDLSPVIKYRDLVRDYKLLYKDYIKYTQKRRKEFRKYIMQHYGGEELPSQQAKIDTTSRWKRIFNYEKFKPMCDAGGELTLDEFFKIMISDESFVRPKLLKKKGPVKPDSKIKLWPLGTIEPIVNETNHTVVLLTTYGHSFYPGGLMRRGGEQDGKFGVYTVATGYAPFHLRKLDKWLSGPVWGWINHALSKALKGRQSAGPEISRGSNSIFSRIDWSGWSRDLTGSKPSNQVIG